MAYKTIKPPKKINIYEYLGWVKSLMNNYGWISLAVIIVVGFIIGFAHLLTGLLLWSAINFVWLYSKNKDVIKEAYKLSTSYIKDWWSRKPEHKV